MNNATFSSGAITKEEYQAQKAWGLLASINLYQCHPDKLTEPAALKDFVLKLCEQIEMQPQGEPMVEKFGQGDIEGYSVMLFIKTSSITIHCDDKIGQRVFLDIFSCKYFDAQKALEFSQNFFETKEARVWCLLRN